MSLHLNVKMARLTVLGYGWNNGESIDSGGGYTMDGDLWKDIATDLNYDFGVDTDWDLISGLNTMPDIDWTGIVYTDPDFDPTSPDLSGIYTDFDGTGTWTNPTTGLNYSGVGSSWIPESQLLNMADGLSNLAASDSSLLRYSIPDSVIPSLYSGKVSTEISPLYTDSDRPHLYSPPVWYLQKSNSDGWIFLGEPFVHTNASGGNITVYDEAVTIRDGSTKAVYWSDCTTHFWDNYVPSPYNSYPIQYVCWQCLYGSLSKHLISTNANTITREDIENGTTGLTTMTYNGTTYYKFKDSQVRDRI